MKAMYIMHRIDQNNKASQCSRLMRRGIVDLHPLAHCLLSLSPLSWARQVGSWALGDKAPCAVFRGREHLLAAHCLPLQGPEIILQMRHRAATQLLGTYSPAPDWSALLGCCGPGLSLRDCASPSLPA